MVVSKIIAIIFTLAAIAFFILGVLFILIPFGQFTFVFLLFSLLCFAAAAFFWGLLLPIKIKKR